MATVSAYNSNSSRGFARSGAARPAQQALHRACTDPASIAVALQNGASWADEVDEEEKQTVVPPPAAAPAAAPEDDEGELVFLFCPAA